MRFKGIRWLTPIVGVVAFAAVLRLFRLGTESLWGDEINMVRFATGERPWELAFGNAPAYVGLLRLMLRWSGSDWWLRLPAAVFGVLSVVLIWELGRRLVSEDVGLAAAWLLAVSPMAVAYSQEVHCYSAYLMLTLSASVVLVRQWRAGATPRSWLALGLLTGIAASVHLYAAFAALALAGFRLCLGRSGRAMDRRGWLGVAGGLSIALLIMLPWVVRDVIPQVERVWAGSSPGGGPERPAGPAMIVALARAARELVMHFADGFAPVVIVAIVAVLGAAVGVKRSRRETLALLLWFAVPWIPTLIVSRAAGLAFASRRMIIVLPPLLLVVAMGLTWIVDKIVAAAFGRNVGVSRALVALCALGWASTVLPAYYVDGWKPDFKRASLLLQKMSDTDDIVVMWKPDQLEYYGTGPVKVAAVWMRSNVAALLAGSDHRGIWYLRPRGVVHRGGAPGAMEQLMRDEGRTFRMGLDLIISYRCPPTLSHRECRERWSEILAAAADLRPWDETLTLQREELEPRPRS